MPRLSLKFIKIAVASSIIGVATGTFASKMISAIVRSSENNEYSDHEEVLYHGRPFDQ